MTATLKTLVEQRVAQINADPAFKARRRSAQIKTALVYAVFLVAFVATCALSISGLANKGWLLLPLCVALASLIAGTHLGVNIPLAGDEPFQAWLAEQILQVNRAKPGTFDAVELARIAEHLKAGRYLPLSRVVAVATTPIVAVARSPLTGASADFVATFGQPAAG